MSVATASSVTPLHQISVGEVMCVVDFQGHPDVVDRLQDMGFVVGSQVQLFSKLVFGGPLAVQVRGACIVLRPEDAACVLVSTSQPVYSE